MDREHNNVPRPNSHHPTTSGDDNSNRHRHRHAVTSSDVEGSVISSSADSSSPPRPPTSPTAGCAVPGYDPNRIPSGVFASKSGNGIEWSTASNESLFSIYMGNNSFSRDQIAMMYKSGELPMLDQDYYAALPPTPAARTTNNQPPSSLSAATWQPPLPPPANQPINNINIINIHVPANPPPSNNITINVPQEVQLPNPPATAAAPVASTQSAVSSLNRNSTSSSSNNRNSTSSTKSFQFPILQNEQMGRNSTRKVEAEQKAAGEKKAAVAEEPNEAETRQNEKQAEEQQQQPEQPVKTTTEEPQSTTCCKVTAAAKSWMCCLPCFSRSSSS
ncbi:unnamed protein product [Linum tenue]|uniref:Uncharacterized protein n=1 Tax=Linum tenue TaxID=586396 RepID=A0AAV0N5U6_9ROSI|nr:unnamed protein product [Linum tenue]